MHALCGPQVPPPPPPNSWVAASGSSLSPELHATNSFQIKWRLFWCFYLRGNRYIFWSHRGGGRVYKRRTRRDETLQTYILKFPWQLRFPVNHAHIPNMAFCSAWPNGSCVTFSRDLGKKCGSNTWVTHQDWGHYLRDEELVQRLQDLVEDVRFQGGLENLLVRFRLDLLPVRRFS